MTSSAPGGKSAEAYRTISEVAEALKLPQHVLRFWETRFAQIRPMKRGGNRRYYRPEDVELLASIRQLLYAEGYTIKGVQRLLRENGPRAVAALGQRGAFPAGGRSVPGDGADADPADVALTESGFAGKIRDGSAGPSSVSHDADAQERGEPYSGDPVDRLRAVLASLTYCRQVLEAARA